LEEEGARTRTFSFYGRGGTVIIFCDTKGKVVGSPARRKKERRKKKTSDHCDRELKKEKRAFM